jgi:hypothetical protein
VFSKSKIFKFLKRDWGTIPVAEIINGKIEIFSKHQSIATESSKYLLIFVLYVCVILCEFGTAISKRYACFCCLFKIFRFYACWFIFPGIIADRCKTLIKVVSSRNRIKLN